MTFHYANKKAELLSGKLSAAVQSNTSNNLACEKIKFQHSKVVIQLFELTELFVSRLTQA